MSNPVRPNRLIEQAKALNTTPEKLVVATVRHEGSITGAARKLDVAANTIRHWLKRAGYRSTVRRSVTLEKDA